MVVRLPRLLDQNMNEVARLHPTKLNISPNGDSLSTASMTLPDGEPRVCVRDWVELCTAHGSAGIYRVTRQKDDIGNEQRLTLTHGLCALEDAVIPGEGTLSGSPAQVLAAILSHQKRPLWMIGDVANGPNVEVEYSYTNALEALENMLSKLPDHALTFDQTSLPWKLGLAALSAEDGAEARLSRNLKGVSVEDDDSELCTRVYVDDREGFVRDGPTIGTWGAVERVLTVPDGATDAEVEAYVQAYLEEHKNPARTIALDAQDLSESTLEALDSFRMWKLARVPLPGRSEVLRERIRALDYPDVFDDPTGVRVTMGRRERTTSDMLRDLMNRTARSERDAADTSKRVSRNSSRIQQNTTRLEDTWTEIVEFEGQTGERFNDVYINLDAQQAQIDLKASSEVVTDLAKEVSEAQILIDGMNATIDLHASRIRNNEEQISQANVKIDGANAAITLQASRVDNVEGRVSSAEVAIDGANAQIALKVNRNGVIAAINLTPEEARIQASRIVLDGYVTASRLESEVASIQTSFSQKVTTINMYANNVYTPALWVDETRARWKQATVVTGAWANADYNDGNTYRIVDGDGTMRTITVPRSVSSVSVGCDTATLNYLGF